MNEEKDIRGAAVEISMIMDENARSFLPGGENEPLVRGLAERVLRLCGGDVCGVRPQEVAERLLLEFYCLMWFCCCLSALLYGGEETCEVVRRKVFPLLACAARDAGWETFERFLDLSEDRVDQYSRMVVGAGMKLPAERLAGAAACHLAAFAARRCGSPGAKLEKEPHLIANFKKLAESTLATTASVLGGFQRAEGP